MKRLKVLSLLMVVLVVILTACGENSGTDNAGTANANNAGTANANNTAADAGNAASTASTAETTSADGAGDAGTATKLSGKVVIYSPNNADINNPIVKEFQERTGVQVELIAGGTGELLKRVEAEKDNPLGDVMFGGDIASLRAYGDYLEPYETKEKTNLNPGYLDTGSLYTPFTLLPMVIMYNKDLVSETDAPKSWNDLLNEKWKGKIAFADPGKSSSSFTQLATMLTAYGKDDEKGWDFVKKFVANLDGKLLSGSGLVYEGVASKEFAVGITLEEAALRYVEGGAPVGIVYPSEGTVVTPDGMAVIKGAKNQANAQAFIDFASGIDVQNLLQDEFLRRSVRNDVAPKSGLPEIGSIKTVDYDYDWVTANKTAIGERFTRVVTGQE